MIKKFDKVTEHTDGHIGMTQNFAREKNGIYKTRLEEHKEIRSKAEEIVERKAREGETERVKTNEVV